MSTATARIAVQPDPLEELFSSFAPASMELLGQRTLLSRVDSKFVVATEKLNEILGGLTNDYAVLRVDSGCLASYDSLYFDTSTLQCWHDHRRGRRNRHKVRVRHYPDRKLTFLEVKTKKNEVLTDKKRIPMPYLQEQLGAAERDFLRPIIGAIADDLHPQISILYQRVSLLSLTSDERLTIDLGLSAGGAAGSVVGRALGHLAVIEVKQWPYCLRTPIMRALRDARARVMSMSKYFTAISLMRPELGRNRLLPALKTLERI